VIITPIVRSKLEKRAGKYLDRENPHPQIHPDKNSTLNSIKSMEKKNESNSPSAKLSRKRPIPEKNNSNARNRGRNLNLSE
jgi:hypothetical protein